MRVHGEFSVLFLVLSLCALASCCRATRSKTEEEACEVAVHYFDDGKSGSPLFSDISGFIKQAKAITLCVWVWVPQRGERKTVVDSTEGLQAVEGWLKKNLTRSVPYSNMGAVESAYRLIIFKRDDFNKSLRECPSLIVPLWTQVGECRLIPDSELEALEKIFSKWGEPVK